MRHGETTVVPRVSDLEALASSTQGKIEIESLEEGRDGQIIDSLIKAAVLSVYKEKVQPDMVREIVGAFDDGTLVHAGEDITSSEYVSLLASMPALTNAVISLAASEHPADVASAVEFVLEGLHLSKRLNKDSAGAKATYRSRG